MKGAALPRSARSGGRRVRPGASAAGLIVLALVVSGCGSAAEPAPVQVAPLTTSMPVAAGTWVVVPVGASSGEGRFWELLWSPSHSARWSLVTPPGVQDNGGLTLAPSPRGTTFAGFVPSDNLHFSPLARTADQGRSWSPDLLPEGLAAGPDSLAAGAGDALLALTPRHGGEVLDRFAHGASWRPLVSAGSLAATAAAHECGLASLGAVAFGSGRYPSVGGACEHPGQIGEYVDDRGTWHHAAPVVPAGLNGYTADVLRLTDTPAGTFSLASLTYGSKEELIAAWSQDGGRDWLQAKALRLRAGQNLISAGPGPHHEAYVLAGRTDGSETLAVSAGPAAPWRSSPPPPTGMAAVALLDDGKIDGFTVRGKTIEEWSLAVGGQAWHRGQVIHVAFN